MNMCECMSRLLPSRLLRVKESIYIYIYIKKKNLGLFILK